MKNIKKYINSEAIEITFAEATDGSSSVYQKFRNGYCTKTCFNSAGHTKSFENSDGFCKSWLRNDGILQIGVTYNREKN